jgi:hypothetical protein
MGGAIVIAKISDKQFGFQKGDTLEITKCGVNQGVYHAKNLTRKKDVVILEKEFEIISAPNVLEIREKKFLGFTYYREVIKEAK